MRILTLIQPDKGVKKTIGQHGMKKKQSRGEKESYAKGESMERQLIYRIMEYERKRREF